MRTMLWSGLAAAAMGLCGSGCVVLGPGHQALEEAAESLDERLGAIEERLERIEMRLGGHPGGHPGGPGVEHDIMIEVDEDGAHHVVRRQREAVAERLRRVHELLRELEESGEGPHGR